MPVFREPGIAAAWNPHALFLNPSATDPLTDNEGDPLVEGAWYYNTTNNVLRIYNGSVWADFTAAGGTITGSTTFTGTVNVDLDLSVDGEILAADGTAASPSISFINETDTGLYKSAANTIGFSAGGALRAYLDTSAWITSVQNKVLDGSASAPSYSFTNDPNTGLYSVGADNAGMSIGGTVRWSWSTTRAWSSNPLYVGTDSSAGSISDVTRMNAGRFGTANGNTGSIATATPTTIFTVPSMASEYATYIVTAALAGSNDVGNYHAVSLVSCNGSSSIVVAAMQLGGLLVIDNSGMNVRVTQTSGISSVVSWNAIRIA